MVDPPLIIYDEEDISEGLEQCSRSLVFGAIKRVSRWKKSWGKKFQFRFDKVKDAECVLRGSPRIFRNAWLSLHRWERGQEIEDLSLSTVPLKIQIWGLALHCRTTKMGIKIGACMGEVLESESFEIKEKGSFIKVLVKFDTRKPLKPGINVGSRMDGISWVDFRYERLPRFCYSCGLVGHEESGCNSPHKQEDNQEESMLGPWLRASQFRRKIHAQGPEYYESHHPKRNKGKKEAMPTELLNMLSALSVTKELPDSVDTQERTDAVPTNHQPTTEGVSTKQEIGNEDTNLNGGKKMCSTAPECFQPEEDIGKENNSVPELVQVQQSTPVDK
ncbi:Zinc knuckle CX2CX4HX4C [Sesbania bispinosa]|nr:Zinc knuckle CX2CX4HX4C [Sesbania bispinosa]